MRSTEGEVNLTSAPGALTVRELEVDMTKETKEAVMTVHLHRDSAGILCAISPPSSTNTKRQL